MATQQQVAHYQGLAQQAERIGIAAGHRARQIVEQRMQAARIAGLTWGDVACAIRALGMPEASEDFVKVCRALHHVVGERGYDNAEELLLSLDVAAECAEELRLPPPLDPEQQRAADIEYRREADADARRQGFL